MFDVVVVGAGPAGLNAALVSGRQRRRVLLLDSGAPRNAPAQETHMLLSRDGLSPTALREAGQADLRAYPTVETRSAEVVDASAIASGFELTLADGGRERARKLVLATGQTDVLADVPGLAERFGRSVFHCPFCHGYEAREQPIAVLGSDFPSVMLALYVADRFSGDVVLCGNGEAPPDEHRERLEKAGVAVREERVTEVRGEFGALELRLEGGRPLARGAVFHRTRIRQHSDLAERLGCELLPDGCVRVDEFQQTSVRGVYAAGDMARLEALPDAMTFVVMGAADGARAAIWVDQELFREDAGLPAPNAS
ncbi:NAD(P)/FAD-dependent oxidoreductase [Nonomuraea angiospora]|uniref:Thioredoxin reductase n=1 Tax=Nonomuraea angiospora TaxID=46172 RepID=A0ABR9LVT5_9ACTN|nr:NAD(P)/FAD-dependent oxidoreductase [Nonomuraea angiospora]MBE1584186.1 thioredoxin reductase [Nonomuraea angiospora]